MEITGEKQEDPKKKKEEMKEMKKVEEYTERMSTVSMHYTVHTQIKTDGSSFAVKK